MSEIGLNINVDSYNNEGIKTIKGNNNAEIYKLYILKNKRRLSLVGKTVKLGYVMAGTTNGDVIENLNITNAEQGEITFPITNRISKQDGVYSCQLAIYGSDGFLEHTATFGLTVEANIFNKIANEIADSKDFTYLENILDKASKLSEKLKENISSATNANSNLESNITEANNINSKLLENTSTATSLNKNLESNIDLAKEVKETIKDLDNKNIEATEKIETLEGLNAKAEELSNNINEALPVKDALIGNTEEAKVANTNLVENISILETKLDIAKETVQNLEPINEKIDSISKQLEENKKASEGIKTTGAKLLANYTHTSNKLVVPVSLDLDTGIYTTKEPHGLENENCLIPNFFVKDKYPTGQISDTPVEFWEYDYTTWYLPKVEKIDEYKFKLKNNKDNSYIKYDKQKNSKLKCGNWGFEVPSGTISLTNINFSKYKKIRIIINSNNYCKGYSSDVFQKIFNKEVPLPIDTSRKIPYVWQPYDSICPKELEEQKFKNECIDLTLEIEDDRVYQKSIRSIVGFKAWLHYNHPQNQNMPYTDTICFVSDKIEGIKFADNIQLLDLNYKYLNGATIKIYGEV